LGGLFLAYALVASEWSNLKWDLVFAAIMFFALLVFYALGWVGGGDVKILALAFLWVGFSGAPIFSILLAICSGAHAIAAKLGWVKSQLTDGGRRRIPFAPSVACAVIGTFFLQALQRA
jgi:prepilin peptidase CpaA